MTVKANKLEQGKFKVEAVRLECPAAPGLHRGWFRSDKGSLLRLCLRP